MTDEEKKFGLVTLAVLAILFVIGMTVGSDNESGSTTSSDCYAESVETFEDIYGTAAPAERDNMRRVCDELGG